MTVIGFITEAAVVTKILTHLGLPTTPPPISPPRLPQQVEMFDDTAMRRASAGAPRRGGRDPPSEPEGEVLFEHDEHDEHDDTGDWAA